MIWTTALAMWSGCVAVAALSAQAIQPPPTAFMTSERVVYGYDQPVDLTFSITVPEGGSVLPRFAIVNEAGETVDARDVDGRYFWETPGEAIDGTQRPGSIPAGHRHTETIDDLRLWYELDEPGMYRITFDGQWSPEAKALTSNTLMIRIARPPSEDEPHGEPTEGRVIPLSDIWALGMPGTKPMARSRRAVEGELVTEIQRAALEGNENLLAPAREGFVVHGTGMQALREAYAVLVEGEIPSTHFRRGEHGTIVFFSKSFGAYVHLDRVVDRGSVIEISYRLVPHVTREVTSHIALIPVTLNDGGLVRVEMRPIMSEQRLGHPRIGDFMHRIMPQSFEVEVVEVENTDVN